MPTLAPASQDAGQVRRAPLTAAGPLHAWARWARVLLSAARGRLVGAPLLLLAAFSVVAGALWLFGRLANSVADGRIPPVDAAVLAWLEARSSPALDRAAILASAMGAEVVMALLVVLVVVFAWQRRWGAAFSLLVVTIGAQNLDTVLKDTFRRVRPNPVVPLLRDIMPAQAWSFPSGHSMVAAAFYLFVAYVAWRVLPHRFRIVGVSALVVLVLLIGLSRLYLGVHYLTDVLAGFVAGATWTGAVILAGHLLAGPRRR